MVAPPGSTAPDAGQDAELVSDTSCADTNACEDATDASSPTSDASSPTSDAGAAPPTIHRTRRLSNWEIHESLDALVGVVPESWALIPPDSKRDTFTRVADSQTMSRTHLDAFMTLAGDVAHDLIRARALDRAGSACRPEILPRSGPFARANVIGASIGVGPNWAIQAPDVDQPNVNHVRYAADVSSSYTHEFSGTGRYEITLSVRTGGQTVDTITAKVDDEIVLTKTAASGHMLISYSYEVTAPGQRLLSFDFETEPDDNNLSLRFEWLRIDGPVDEGQGIYDDERRACAASIVDELGARAFRRPLSDGERAKILGLYDDYVSTAQFSRTISLVFQAILANPNFLYLIEYGTLVEGSAGVYELDDWELASRLSYSVCERPPDATLRAAAASGALTGDPTELERQARRLMELPCAQATIRRFFEQWLWLDRLPTLNKDAEVFPSFTDEVRVGMYEEAHRLIHELFWTRGSKLEELFTTDEVWANEMTAPLYGLDAPPAQGPATLGVARAGILTQAGVLAVTSTFDATSPVRRGVYVLEQLLCERPAPPPDELEVAPPLPDPNLTTRERWAAHSSDPACAGCHGVIDPIGFAFEGFDGIGRERTMENGRAVDTSGGAPSIGVGDGEVEGAAELSRLLGASPEVTECFARQWLRFGLGRVESELDEPLIADMASALGQGSMKEALVFLLTSPTMRRRY